jgi:hypothetical protein
MIRAYIPNLSAAVPVNALISHLRSEIVRLYGRQAELDGLVAPHLSLIEVVDRLTPEDAALHVFTTNYDAIIERALEGGGGGILSTGRNLRVCTGLLRVARDAGNRDSFSRGLDRKSA